jgi:hypothetical protein
MHKEGTMAKFQVGDMVTTTAEKPAKTGNVVEINEGRLGFIYTVQMNQTGLMRPFFESQLEAVEKSSQQSA